MHRPLLPLLLLLSVFSSFGSAAFAAFRTGGMFDNHMVLQSAPQQAVVWGHTPNDTLTVHLTISGLPGTLSSASTSPGFWSIQIPPQAPGGPFNLTFSMSGQPTVVLTDVLFGEVFICSGQSNMALPVKSCDNASAEYLASKDYTRVRYFRPSGTTQLGSATPLTDYLAMFRWWSGAVKGNSFNDTSCLCWQYARRLYDYFNGTRPIGTYQVSVGSTSIVDWAPANSSVTALCNQSNTDAVHAPGFFWNGLVSPLLNVTVGGILWYQGENEANAKSYHNYGCALSELMRIWRSYFGANATFLVVQICTQALCPSCHWTAQSEWPFAEVRWRQSNATGYVPNDAQPAPSAMIVSIDLGQAGVLHPTDKTELGRRLAAAMANVSYGLDLGPYQSPAVDPLYPSVCTGDGQAINLTLGYRYAGETGLSVNALAPGAVGFEAMLPNGTWLPASGVSVLPDGSSVAVTWLGYPADSMNAWRYAWRDDPCTELLPNGTRVPAACQLGAGSVAAAPWIHNQTVSCPAPPQADVKAAGGGGGATALLPAAGLLLLSMLVLLATAMH